MVVDLYIVDVAEGSFYVVYDEERAKSLGEEVEALLGIHPVDGLGVLSWAFRRRVAGDVDMLHSLTMCVLGLLSFGSGVVRVDVIDGSCVVRTELPLGG